MSISDFLKTLSNIFLLLEEIIITQKDKIKIISISSQKVINSIDNSEEICFSVFIQKKENVLILKFNNI